MVGRWLSLCFALLLPATALAITQAPSPELLPEIIVEAPDEMEIAAFVGQALPDTRERQLARWHHPICVAYRGFSAAQERVFHRHMQTVSELVEMPAPPSDCRPNVVVLLTDQPDRLVDLMLERQERLFKPTPIAQVRKALVQDRAVRMWHVTVINGKYGNTPDALDMAGPLSSASSIRAAPGSLSRLGKQTRIELFRTMIVLDAGALRGLPLSAVADHVGLRVMGGFAADAETPLPSILNLFQSGQKATLTLTEWDKSLLRGLYQAPVDTHMNRQRRMIARRLTDTAAAQP
ncbi:hypothetical protein CHU95_16625 [Niveispirillum lacus]|uniref:Uncharacterized protein n=1 Tax=Niveispirillum lacus TaxID=1981099 RepID=A0A255YUU3_9PROT|nr:hypothetical protein [Niveispirillum lacus]OYQ32425.1 hypothetical protein CHU95_16625 [Niveispirillum lacus]